jgi:hypothetical protein
LKENLIPQEITNILTNYPDDYYNFCITKAGYAEKDFVIEVSIQVNEYQDSPFLEQQWSIHALGCVEKQISFEEFTSFALEKEHPLLWQYTDKHYNLYFSGLQKDPGKLAFSLYLMHRKIYGDFMLNMPWLLYLDPEKPLRYSSGILAQGPKKLLLKYADCLEENGVAYTIINEQTPAYWNGNEFIPYEAGLSILLLGDTYIVAKNFSFIQVNFPSH